MWTALATEGMGASLQHYNPIIDDEAAQVFGVLKLEAACADAFGLPIGEPAELEYINLENRVVVKINRALKVCYTSSALFYFWVEYYLQPPRPWPSFTILRFGTVTVLSPLLWLAQTVPFCLLCKGTVFLPIASSAKAVDAAIAIRIAPKIKALLSVVMICQLLKIFLSSLAYKKSIK